MHVEGLLDIVIGPGAQRFIPEVRQSRHHEHRSFAGIFLSAQIAADLKPVDIGHPPVKNEKVDPAIVP